MQFEWDDSKNRKNIEKHGISFHTAILVFQDDDRIEAFDEKHSTDEDRYITIGEINGSFIVVTVVYTERSEALRIISARFATKEEQEVYNDRKNNT